MSEERGLMGRAAEIREEIGESLQTDERTEIIVSISELAVTLGVSAEELQGLRDRVISITGVGDEMIIRISKKGTPEELRGAYEFLVGLLQAWKEQQGHLYVKVWEQAAGELPSMAVSIAGRENIEYIRGGGQLDDGDLRIYHSQWVATTYRRISDPGSLPEPGNVLTSISY